VKPIRAMIKLHYVNTRLSFLIFWTIFISIFALSAFALSRFDNGSSQVNGGTMSIYIYMLILGIVSFKETFAYSLGMNVRRKDFINGLILSFIGLSAVMTALNLALSYVEDWVVRSSNIRIAFFSLAKGFQIPITRLEEALINFSGMLLLLSFGLLMAVSITRLKKLGTFILGGGLILTITLMPTSGWVAIGKFLVRISTTASELSLWFLLGSAIWLAATYFLVRRMTTA
jgi:hypothetical protein